MTGSRQMHESWMVLVPLAAVAMLALGAVGPAQVVDTVTIWTGELVDVIVGWLN